MATSRSRTPLMIGIGIVVGLACLLLVVVLILTAGLGGLLFWRNSGIGMDGPPPDSGQELVLPPGVSGEELTGDLSAPGSLEEAIAAA